MKHTFKSFRYRPFSFYINMNQFAFQVGYSYEKMEEEVHLFWITVAFFHVEIAWR